MANQAFQYTYIPFGDYLAAERDIAIRSEYMDVPFPMQDNR